MMTLYMDQARTTDTVCLSEDGDIKELYVEERQGYCVGNVHIGRVTRVVDGLNCAFVDIGKGQHAYLPLQERELRAIRQQKNHMEQDPTERIKVGDFLIVQIDKQPSGDKAPMVSAAWTVPGRYCVLLPYATSLFPSKRMDLHTARSIEEIYRSVHRKICGCIIRTRASHEKADVLKADYEACEKQLTSIIDVMKANPRVGVVAAFGELFCFVMRELAVYADAVAVTDRNLQEQIHEQGYYHAALLDASDTKYWKSKIQACEEKRNRKTIHLPCGGSIVIEKTEALTVIDVNSAHFTGRKNRKNTIETVNHESSVEIAKQLRLRDIGGAILIDYITMSSKKSQDELIRCFKEELKRDAALTKVYGFTSLHLLEMTRRKKRPDAHRT